MNRHKYLTHTALLTAAAVLLGYIESLLPPFTSIPGVKPGLGNTAVLIALFLLNSKSALAVALLKVFLCSMLYGGFTVFLYSFCGAVLSLLIMIAAKKTKLFSVVGTSLLGGIFHNLGQLFCAYFIVGTGVLYYIPLLCASGMAAGVLTGILSAIIIKRGQNIFDKK